MENTKINFVDWFDPNNIDHVLAYEHLMNNGFWPQGFKPENAIMTPQWQVTIAFKMSDCWVNHMKKVHTAKSL